MAVPFGTKTRTMTTDRRRSSKWLAFQFAGALLLLVAGGGTVWMLQTTDGGLTTTAVERNRDILGFSCCKHQSKECAKYNDANRYGCVGINGYEGVYHQGASGNDLHCCTDKDKGTFHFHIVPGQSSCT